MERKYLVSALYRLFEMIEDPNEMEALILKVQKEFWIVDLFHQGTYKSFNIQKLNCIKLQRGFCSCKKRF